MLWQVQSWSDVNVDITSLTKNQRDAPAFLGRLLAVKHPSMPTQQAVDEI
jgi:hypothetical protein